ELRFATARALFDSFTMANSRISVPPTDEPALDFLRGLVSQDKLDDAVTFCAYLLGRRECVWWGCRSVRRLLDPIPPAQMPALDAAEAWVRDPSSEMRQAAQDAATQADQNTATAWNALSAAWSGGTMSAGRGLAIAPPPELTPHAAAVAMTLAGAYLAPDQRKSILKTCIDEGARLAETGLS
ncbi:MAG: hypothetical protein J0I13_16240, partial [Rhizobiales bacterium]|nr:hypothetical protein [Hyphomicrobiales bacterium]